MSLKERLSRAPVVVAPGVYDALTASLATEAGFQALYVSGAAIAYTRLGRPDIGLVEDAACVGGRDGEHGPVRAVHADVHAGLRQRRGGLRRPHSPGRAGAIARRPSCAP